MAILTDSLETALAKVRLLGASTIRPPATRCAFLEKSSILIENTMWHFMYWEPTGGLSSLSRTLNATFTALLSFCIAFHQRSFPFSLSKVKASSTVLGTLIPNLCVILWYLLLTAAIILCLLFKTWGVHQEKAGSSLIPIASAYSTTSTGYDSFMSLSLSHEVDLSFHSMQSCHPLVVFCLYVLRPDVTSWSCLEMPGHPSCDLQCDP